MGPDGETSDWYARRIGRSVRSGRSGYSRAAIYSGPPKREVGPLSWEVYVSKETRNWLIQCHPDPNALAEVASGFAIRLQKIRLLGPIYAKDTNNPIKHLTDIQDLYEARVRHSTGWYRLFFRFVTIDGKAAAAFGGIGVVKKEADLPRRTLDVASGRVDEYVAGLRASSQMRATDRMK